MNAAVKAEGIEVLLGRARGRADLNRRSYSVSKSLSDRLSEMLDVAVEWEFDRFFYQVGIFQAADDVVPEGFLLTCRSNVDGSVIRHFAAVNPFRISALLPLTDKRTLAKYQSIYLGDSISPDVAPIFAGLKQLNPKKAFFELTPILRSHADFYRLKYGLNLSKSTNQRKRSVGDEPLHGGGSKQKKMKAVKAPERN